MRSPSSLAVTTTVTLGRTSGTCALRASFGKRRHHRVSSGNPMPRHHSPQRAHPKDVSVRSMRVL